MVDAEPEHAATVSVPSHGRGMSPALSGQPELTCLRAEACDRELRVELAYRDEAEGSSATVASAPREDSAVASSEEVSRSSGRKLVTLGASGGDDRLDLGCCPGTDGRRLRAGSGRGGENRE